MLAIKEQIVRSDEELTHQAYNIAVFVERPFLIERSAQIKLTRLERKLGLK